jgi:lipopolysaccharide/colanic/teichoic acid biosynthesis glycosyltransferase
MVGPRPHAVEHNEQYAQLIGGYHGRHRVKPGITGWAQINGRTSLPWPERIELDVWYVEHRSLRLDLRILRRTARMLATGHGLYSEDLKQGW